MIAHTSHLSRRRNRRKIGTAGWVIALTLLTFTALQPSAAAASKVQRIITTIIPWKVVTLDPADSKDTFRSDKPVLLRFRTDALPAEVTVDKATLRLVCQDMLKQGDGRIQVFFVAEDDWDQETLVANKIKERLENLTNFGTRSFDKSKPGENKAAQWQPTDVPSALKGGGVGKGKTSFALLLWPMPKENPARQWYSTTADNLQYRPRLILKYTVQPSPQPIFQSDGLPAVRSSRAFVPEKNPSIQNSYISRRVVSGWSYAPAFYNNLVYTLTERNSQKYLNALSPLGALIWSVAIPAPPDGAPKDPGQHLAVSNSGRLYIVGNQRIIVFQLDPNNPTQKPAVLHNLSVKDLNPDVPPRVGPDGSLYFVNLKQVYGLNPDLQELWKVNLTNTGSSRLTVGPSGEFVYLTSRTEGLVAINAQTGECFTNPLPNQEALKGIDNPALHAPVVIRHPDGTEKIYAAANSANTGVLACFDNFKTNSDYGLAKGEIKQAWKIEGLFSQPSLDPIQPNPKEEDSSKSKKLYSVNVEQGRGELIAIDWLNRPTPSEGESFPVGEKGPYILNGGNLALDKDGHVFIWNGDGGQSNLYGFKASLSRIFDVMVSHLPPKSQLLFGNDGTLYANDVKGRVLRAVLPQYTLGEEIKDTDIYSPTHLWVDGTAGQEKEWILKAGGSVLLGNGFAVKKGTTLKVQISVRN